MANTFLTPVTLWKDFDDTLPLEVMTLSERNEDGIIQRDIRFLGRRAGVRRVNIYAKYVFPEKAGRFPAIMVFFEAGNPFDEVFVKRFVRRGYGVLCVDYCGDNGTDLHTVYPPAVDYANYVRAGTHLNKAEPTARETSWYEWAGVARYAAKFLATREEVTKYGAIGLRTGGEIIFKIAPYVKLGCMISVCAAGWLAYRGREKFTGEKQVFDEEHHRFIAGLDSQSYAPYINCPVLLLSAVNDTKHDYDRVYDTFQQLNPAIQKSFLYSSHGNGLIGSHSIADIDLFLDKYLKDMSVFVSDTVDLAVEENDCGDLVAKVTFDKDAELKECGIFFTEQISGAHARDWTRVLGSLNEVKDNSVVIPLSIYEKSSRALVYAFANYSNNFSVTSKIQEVVITKPYRNACLKSRIIYSAERDSLNGVSGFRRRARSIASCFADSTGVDAKLLPGYGGLLGATAEAGLVSYRVNEPRYAAPDGASLRLDAYCKEDAHLKVIFYFDGNEEKAFATEVWLEGGGKWKSFCFDASDFKSQTGEHIENFRNAVSLVFIGDKEVLINNIL